MRKYRHRERGSITVFLTIILVPTIFLTGLLTDLARIKLYSNQALMAADNYGEAVLTQYDNVLKELYGLFSVTQDEKGLKAVETLQDYMKTSFDPSTNSTQFKHLKGTFLNKGKSYDGDFMPYKKADVKMEWEAASDDANLKNDEVLSTQIGDFMRYRIVKEGVDWLLEAMDDTKHVKADTEVMEKKTELDEQIGKALEKQKAFYEQLKKMDSYYENYLKYGLNNNYQDAKSQIDLLVKSERYQTYIAAAEEAEKEKEQPAIEEQDEDESQEDESQEEENSIDLAAEGVYFSTQFDELIKPYQKAYNNGEPQVFYPVTFSNYEQEANLLMIRAREFKTEAIKIRSASEQVTGLLNNNNDVSNDLKTNVQKDLDENYANVIDTSVADTYVAISDLFQNSVNINNNHNFGVQATTISYSLDDEKNYYLRYYTNTQDQYASTFNINNERATDIRISEFKDFKNNSHYLKAYNDLKKSFEGDAADSEAEKQAKKNKTDAEAKTQEKEDAFDNQEETTSARNIPAGVDIGKDGRAGIVHFDGIIKSAASLLNMNWRDAGNELLLKVYTVVYDFGMFSDRITEKKEGDQESLTGYSMCQDINYLYGAELEYLYGGFKNSSENLKETRNQIVLFRAAVNLASTYTVREVNDAISAISKACTAVNPLLGITAAAALRLGVAAIETYEDWSQLKDGKSVALIKRKLEDLTSYDEIVALIPGVEEQKNASQADQTTAGKTIKLNYEQYLTILLIIFTSRGTITQRTGDLICLNVNNVEQGSGFTSLSFQMDKAITAVKASCSVHLDYGVMPDGFAKQAAKSETYQALKDFEKHYYKYSIVRGY